MPDELTHRLWWKLGDYLREPSEQTKLAVLCLSDSCPNVFRSYQIWSAFWPNAPRLRERLESLYSDLTWELMGVVV